jgi:hypothetical protein
MLHKKKKPFIYVIFLTIFYIILFLFIVLGLLQLTNFAYNQYNEEKKVIEPQDIELSLAPIEQEVIVSNNELLMNKEKEEEEPLVIDPKVGEAMNVIANYYKSIIQRNIKSHFSANSKNMCKLAFKVGKGELSIINCDDYTFKRQVELSLIDSKPFKDKVVNGIDLSKEVVYFDYLININK